MLPRIAYVAALVALFTLVSTRAKAQEYDTRRYNCMACGVWLPVGLNAGALSRWDNGNNHGAFLVGAEISVLNISRASSRFGWGGYVDTTYETHEKLLRSSVGPEIIYIGSSVVFGLDLGPLVEWSGSFAHVGVRARLFMPFVFVTPYFGSTGFLFGDHSVSVEGGLLLKYPFLVHEQ